MQTQEILRMLRLPELGDLGQFFRSLSATTLVSMGALAAILAYWFTHRPKALQPPCDLLMQSEEVEDSGGARRSVIGDGPQLLTHYYDDARTMYEVFRRGLSISGEGKCLGGIHPRRFSGLLPLAPFRRHALSFAHNSWFTGLSNVFIYKLITWQTQPLVLLPGMCPHSLTLCDVPAADISTVIVDKPQKAALLLEHVERKETPGLKLIILMEPFEEALKDRGQECGVVVKSMQAVEVRVCFRVGGNPKGAMLTHGNVVADFSGFLKVTESQWAPTCADVHISYLPLAHMFERMVQSVVYCHGGRVGFFQGDIRLLSDDMKALCPTIFPVVPRLLNRMYDKIFSQANTPLKRWLLEFAAKRKQAEVRSGIIRNDSIWDELFFNKIQVRGSSCCRFAPWPCSVYEGYGQTECTAGCTFTTPGDWTSGHVGAPLPCNHIKLVDVEELNYWASQGEGEICVRGPNVFKGYLKDPERTKEALDSEGWLHTGDIGKWLPAGTLKIIDRKKHIFKLAQGEYIAPEKIENIYIRSEPVVQVYVHGDSLKAFLVGIVVPDPEVMPSWAQKRGIEGTYAELCANKELKKAILEDMVRLGKESGLHSFEQVKAIYIHSDMFSVQNGLLTPTLKAKRPELREYFKKQIEELYSISM
uniref:long-chain-fatty-acid--CoA ligase n=1 Tax=Sus scrofa TaxID=9823 RepID=A0A8D1K878_PIG